MEDGTGSRTADTRTDGGRPDEPDATAVETSDSGSATLAVDGATLRLPPDADDDEAAAIAAAVGAHLQDCAAAAAAATDTTDRTERADPWTLAGRMKAMGKRRWPDDVARGEEWKAAARSFE